MHPPRPRHLRTLAAMSALTFAVYSACSELSTEPPKTALLDVTTQTSGADIDNQYQLTFGPGLKVLMQANQTMTLRLDPGPRTVSLDGVESNCIVDGSSTRTVTLSYDQPASTKFVVDCAGTGVRIQTRTTGNDIPNVLTIQIDQQLRTMLSNDSLIITQLQPGHHVVSLHVGGTNCGTDDGDTQFPFDVVNRVITTVVLDISCHTVVRAERIAFVFDTVNSFRQFAPAVSLVNPDGTGLVRLGPGHSPSWSPDGKKLVFSDVVCDDYSYFYYHTCPGGLIIRDPETGGWQQLNNGVFAVSPAWSPTEDLIVFTDLITAVLYSTGSNEIGARRRIVVNGAERIYTPAWSPDGTKLTAICSNNAIYNLCTFNKDGSALKWLTFRGVDSRPSWSPDGQKIVFATTTNAFQEIVLINPDGSDRTTLTEGYAPAWSRDGTMIVFARNNGLYTVRVDGSGLTQITTGHDHDPTWRP